MSNKLKIDNFQQPVNLVEKEHEVLAYWDQTNAFRKSLDERPKNKRFSFFDGPPFATGLPHYGHIVASTTKDVIPRYWTMKGYFVERKWGWDTHGLPIENIIEKELNLADKQAIEDYGIKNFNDACRMAVLRYADEWKRIIRRLGRWVDMDDDYKTMDPEYMESLWWVFKKLWDRGLIYKGHKSMHICPRCSTPLSNFEVTQGYKEVKDITVYAKFKAINTHEKLGLDKPIYFIAWTTTPWTLPGNVLLAVNPNVTYAAFSVPENPAELYIAAKDRLDDIVGAGNYTIIKEFLGPDLYEIKYEPIFPYFTHIQNTFRVVPGEFVSLEEGAGIVHIAPAFGEEDYEIGKREGIPLVQHVNMEGKFIPEVTDFAGLPVKPKDNPLSTDILILKYLQARNSVFKKVNLTHTYPHCWRCDTPLINYATSSWFVAVTQFKDQLLKNNQNTNWIPAHIRDGRFGKWLESARDWAISRSRYWGTPLPIWMNESGGIICVESIQELETLSGQKIDDLHKHVIDSIEFEKDGQTYKRIPDVLDCWFESGSMPYASFHYPFANKDDFEQSFPADFISEGQDQTRGWFYTLHVLATALTLGDDPAIPVPHPTSAFKNVIVNGIVLAEDGKKMSKRLQNYPDPMEIVEKYGVDSLRMYLMSSPVMRAENLNFSEKGVDEIKKKVINIVWNVFSFMRLYDSSDVPPVFLNNPSSVLDRWLFAKTNHLTNSFHQAMMNYDVVSASRLLMEFVNDLSTWYLRLSRERIKSGDRQALQTMKASLYQWMLLAAPFMPFLTETMYQNLSQSNPKTSIHLETFSELDNLPVDLDVIRLMNTVQNIVREGHSARKQTGISLKQPLSKIIVGGVNLPTEYEQLIRQELNVKEVIWNQAENLSVALDTELTPDLIEEGQARELVRTIQAARKAAGTGIDEIITVELPEWPENYESEIMAKVKANKFIRADVLRIIRNDRHE